MMPVFVAAITGARIKDKQILKHQINKPVTKWKLAVSPKNKDNSPGGRFD